MSARTVTTIRRFRRAEDASAGVLRRARDLVRSWAGARRNAPVWKRWLERTLTLAAMASVVWFYHWTVAANSGFDDWGTGDYYRLLVRGWQKGQLHLDIEPSPGLLALADPYDPAHNEPHRLADASLYRNKHYIYFGAAPALTLMLPYALLTGRELTMGAATLVFCVGAFLAGSGLWLAIRRRYFPGSAVWTAPLGVLAIGFGTHLLALAQRPMIWELPIAAGIAFTMFALVACHLAIHGRRPLLAMGAAGLFLGLAVGSRPSFLLAAPLLLAPLWLAWRERKPPRSWWRMALAAALPLGACGLAIMAHNYARFDDPLEWGRNYQLSGAYESKLTHFSLRFLPNNFAVYLFQLLRWTPEFPFALSVAIDTSHIPGHFGTERVAGLAVTFPFFWFALALPLVWLRRPAEEKRALAAVLGCVAGFALPVMVLVMCHFSTTTRYQADFAVALAVLALGGMLGLERWAQGAAPEIRRRGGLIFRGLAAVACIVTVAIGVLMSFDYHGRSMRMSAPEKWQAIARATNSALGNVGRAIGRISGPRVLKVRFQQQPAGAIETFWRAADPRADERILVEHIGERLIRFGYVRGAGAAEWGRPLRWETNHTHTVHVQLPSLYRGTRNRWWGGVRHHAAFRERTCVAVWFSGGRALGSVVEPLPTGFAAGGAVGSDFSGEVRKVATRLFRDDEIPTGLAEPEAKRGGVLRMRVIFPDWLRPEGEPLFAGGAHYRSSIVFVQPAEDGIKFVFENYALSRIDSPVMRPNPAGHELELEMANFNPDAFGDEATGDVVIRIDGHEILRTRQIAYPFHWGNERIGSNPFGTTCAAEFRGWILDAAWVRKRSGPSP